MATPTPKYPILNDSSTEVRIRPRRIATERAPVDLTMNGLFRQVFMSKRKASTGTAGVATKEWSQRCAVQVRYTKGGGIGKWRSHGSYIGRESKDKINGKGLGFDADSANVIVADRVASWRKLGDSLFFRVIISPEFGDRLDLTDATRDMVRRLEVDLGTKLEWVAVEHHNTDNPHVHLVLRGKRDNGQDLRIPEEYVRNGMRRQAEELVTNRLGYRTGEDIHAAQRREITQSRFTGLDRKLKARVAESADGSIRIERRRLGHDDIQAITELHLLCRLRHLQTMGLAHEEEADRWELALELETSLRAVQKSVDRIKMMEAHGVLATDPSLPFRVLKPSDITSLEGTVLVHAQDEYSGNNFALVETAEEIVRVPHVKEIASMRRDGQLNAGRRISVTKTESGFNVQDLGASHKTRRGR
jgi:hypothetical protein